MTQELPQGWAETKLAEIGHWSSGGTPSRRRPEYFGRGIPWIKSGDLRDGLITKTEEEITEVGLQNSSAKIVPAGTISMALYGATIGKLGKTTFPAATNQACANVVPDNNVIHSDYLYFFRLSERQNFIDMGQGGAQPNISQAIIRIHPIRLAPIAEQQRIVVKLEVLLGKVDACRKRLEKIPVILKRFRQSVLAAACSGRLTADWREESDLTGEWPTAILKDVADLRLGKMLDDAKNVGDPTRYLRNVNVRWFSFDLSDLAVMRTTENDKQKLDVRDGDLFVCEGGEPGRCAVWSSGPTDLIFQKAIHRVRPDAATVSSRWVALNLRNDANSDRLEEYFTGTTIKHLTGRSIAGYGLSLSTLPEQHEIVHRVESLFALADQIEARYAKAKTHVDRLTQSILAKAFRGDLVPQDPNDEPVTVLLERIRSQRQAAGAARSQPRRSRRREQMGSDDTCQQPKPI